MKITKRIKSRTAILDISVCDDDVEIEIVNRHFGDSLMDTFKTKAFMKSIQEIVKAYKGENSVS